MARRFAEKTILVTGASSGIGAALARQFAAQGGQLVLCARREAKLEQVREDIESHGGTAVCVSCDVTQPADLAHAVTVAEERFGGLDVVVANAGFGVSGQFETLTVEDFRRQFETNVFGVLNTVYATLPALEARRGRLALVSSVMGTVALPASAPYSSSKFAVTGLAESLYYDLAPKDVSVTCIQPGLVASEFRSVDNEGVYHAGRKENLPNWIICPADKAARAMVRAIYRRKFDAVITGHGKVMVFMRRHAARLTRAFIKFSARGRLANIEKLKRATPDDNANNER